VKQALGLAAAFLIGFLLALYLATVLGAPVPHPTGLSPQESSAP
jgi:hypothetical protein